MGVLRQVRLRADAADGGRFKDSSSVYTFDPALVPRCNAHSLQ